MSTPEPSTQRAPTAATWAIACFLVLCQGLAWWDSHGILDGGATSRLMAIALAGYWSGVACARAVLGPFSRGGLLLAAAGGFPALYLGMVVVGCLRW